MDESWLVAERFRISDPEKDLLGRGGAGDVYLATDTHTGQLVAVKALDPSVVARYPEALERFAREGEALRQLDHPNIVRMVAAVEEEEATTGVVAHYLVMQYVGGGSLADLLAAEGRLAPMRVVDIALDLADALTRAHRLGILHRDLKPANVLLTEEGIPRLTDFGIAHLPDSPRLTQTGMLMGTVDYLSPEACQGQRLDGRADIWSFGVMLYEMLCGQTPFEGDSLSVKLAAILTQPVPDLVQLVPEIPETLADLVYRMLERDRLQRIPSVRLVGAELEAIQLRRAFITPAPSAAPAAGPTPSRFATPTPLGDAPRHNLPGQVTPFVGREAELAELARLLADPQVRLITILGAGGMGKTRLALEAGACALDTFEHGVYLVPLAPLQSAEAVVPAVARAVGLNFSDDGEPLEQLLDHLQPWATLLLLDNFEHLLAEPVAPMTQGSGRCGAGDGTGLVGELLKAGPGVKVLVTSRLRLNIQGEQLFPLLGMEVPDGEKSAEVGACSSVKLFVQGARRLRPDFELVGGDGQHVARICRLVGGMPLAILLAAAWVELLSPEEIEGEITASLDFLETDLRDVPDRQRSIQTVFDHSWNLLSERERAVLAGLSVFWGGFLRQAAQTVTGATLRELKALVDKSLLHRTPSGRYEIHELLRQYGLEKLIERGELEALRQRHLEYCLSLAGQAADVSGQRRLDWLHHLTPEIDNLRAALDWCLSSGSAQTGLRLALQMRWLWGTLGYFRERRDWLERLLAEAPEPTLERARGLEELGRTAYALGDYAEALDYCEESLSLAETLEDLPAIADATFRLAWPAIALGDRARSYALLERSMELFQELGNRDQEAFVVLVLGELARAAGDLERARELHEQSVALHRKLVRKALLPSALYNLGCVLIHFGELDRSQELFRESISIELVRTTHIDCHLMGFAFLANARGRPLRATRLLAASEALREAIGIHVDVGDRPDYDHNLASLRAQLGEGAFEVVWAEGQSLSREEAVALAMSEQQEDADSWGR